MRPKADLRPRENGVLKHRLDRVRDLVAAKVTRQLMHDVDDLAMARYAFMDDVELASVFHRGKRLSRRQQRIAREMEKPKKEAAVLLSLAAERVVNVMRAQNEQKSLSINVERFVVRVPDTKIAPTEDAIIIDAEVSDASR